MNEIEELQRRIGELEAARYAYASEFPPNADGDPDKGSIHENIRKLKAENKKLRVILMSASKKLSSSEDCSDLPQTLYNAALM